MIRAKELPAGADSGASDHLPVQITLAKGSTESGNINRNFYRFSQRTEGLKRISREESEFRRVKKKVIYILSGFKLIKEDQEKETDSYRIL